MKWTSRVILALCLAVVVVGSNNRPRVVEGRNVETGRTVVVQVADDPVPDGFWKRLGAWWSSRFGAKPSILRTTGTLA